MVKTEEHKGKKYLMVNDYMLDKVLDKIKETIDISKFDATKILTDLILQMINCQIILL